MEDSITINNVDRIDHLQTLVIQDLRDVGIKLPKAKKLKKLNQSRIISQQQEILPPRNKIFGESLSVIPGRYIPEYGYVPQFLIDAGQLIEENLDCEGIFRKSGSIGRQKELRAAVEGVMEEGSGMADANIYDLAVLVKQFFRELPEPVFVIHLHDAFIKSYQLPADKDPKKALLRLCLLLPAENLGALRYILHILNRVVGSSEKNKMTANNLAVVMAPNLMHNRNHTQKMNAAEEKMLNIKTCIIELLIRNCKQVGMVDVTVQNQLKLMAESFTVWTDDDLDASDDNTLEESKQDVQHKKKRKRSSSLTGIVSSIARGMSKLRRSTDGKGLNGINMSSNSSYPGELSLTSNNSLDTGQVEGQGSDGLHPQHHRQPPPLINTPHIRKRRLSGDAVPFSASKKKAILGNLPQRSALASAPFTPASTVKRPHTYDESSFLDVSNNHRHLNSTTPISGSKACRKKNLFCSPVSTKRKKGSEMRAQSPTPSKAKKGFFRRLSGGRNERDALGMVSRPLPMSGISVKGGGVAVPAGAPIMHSVSSPSLYEEVNIVGLRDSADMEVAAAAGSLRETGRCWSEEVIPVSVSKDLKYRRVDKEEIGAPCPVIVPVLPDAIDVNTDGEMRRSRRDEFEREKREREAAANKKAKSSNKADLEGGLLKSPARNLDGDMDASLLNAIIPPPQGFGDCSMLEEEKIKIKGCDEDMMVDIESDTVSVMSEMSSAGFSTISGGTVIHRTDSGHYTRMSGRSASGTSIASDPGASSAGHRRGLATSSSRDSDVFVSDFTSLQNIPEQSMMMGDTRRQAAPRGLRRTNHVVTDSVSDVYVTLKPPSGSNITSSSSIGIRLLSDNYASEEDSSGSSTTTGKAAPAVDVGTHAADDVNESLKHMTPKADINRMKSISAQDLQTTPKIETPSRARADSTCLSDTASISSPFCSPSRRFNHKPRLQISRETHKLLTRAGFLAPQSGTDTSRLRDVPVPVKSPERSMHREEMMHTLRASFHETRRSSNLNTSAAGASRVAPHYRSLRCAGERTFSGTSHDRPASGEWEKPLLNVTASSDAEPETSVTNRVVEMSAQLKADLGKKCTEEHLDNDDVEMDDGKDEPASGNDDIVSETAAEEVPTTEMNDKSEISDSICVDELEDSHVEEQPEKTDCKKMTGNKSLTLSKILDKELLEFGPVRIKRAQISLPKHDSIANIQEVKAGSVAQTVKHFTRQNDSSTKQTSSKRGTSPIRIPTIFAKTDEKVRQYREITSFARERLNSREERRSPQKVLSDSDLESDTSMSDGNVTILEVTKHQPNSPDQMEDSPRDDARHSSASMLRNSAEPSPCKRPCSVELSDSLVETIKDLKSSFKSPLRESTNTADSSRHNNDKPITPDNTKKPKSLAGHTPHRVPVPSKNHQAQQHNKKTKSSSSHDSTTHLQTSSEDSSSLTFASVWAHLDD